MRAIALGVALLASSALADEPTGWSEADLDHRCWEHIWSMHHGAPVLYDPDGLASDRECQEWITTRWGDYRQFYAVVPYARVVPKQPATPAMADELVLCEVPEEAVLNAGAFGQFRPLLWRDLCVRVTWEKEEVGVLRVLGTYEGPEPSSLPLPRPKPERGT